MVSNIQAGDGKIDNLFFQCSRARTPIPDRQRQTCARKLVFSSNFLQPPPRGDLSFPPVLRSAAMRLLLDVRAQINAPIRYVHRVNSLLKGILARDGFFRPCPCYVERCSCNSFGVLSKYKEMLLSSSPKRHDE